MNFKNITLANLLLVLFLLGCSDDYLKKLPLDKISADDYWNSPNDLKLYTNQFYPRFADGSTWSGGISWFDTGTDNMLHNSYDDRIAGYRTIPARGGFEFNYNDEKIGYDDIRAVNYFFENYARVSASADAIGQYLGEAYFFRAYFYFNLVRKYGDVPWIDKTLAPESEELFGARTSRKIVVENIIKDLDEAIKNLNSGPVEDGNRLCKEVAMLYKSRVALFEGTWEKYHAGTVFGVEGSDGTAFLEVAATAAEALIDEGTFSLFTTGNPNWDYWHLFNQPYSFAGNSEVMLWKAYDLGLSFTHNHQRYLPRIGGGRGVTQTFINDYLCVDGNPITGNALYQGDATLEDVIANRDARIFQTIYTPGWPMEIVGSDTLKRYERSHLYATGDSKCPTAYQINKGALPDPEQYKSSGLGVNPSVIFRYAEALLNFAEAKAELGSLTQADVDKSIKLLRERVGMPNLDINNIQNDPNWLYPDVSPVINEVRRERNIELAVEGFRWDDVARWRAHHIFTNKRPKGAIYEAALYPELTVGVDVFVDENGYIDPYQNSLPNGYEFDANRDYLAPLSTEELTLNDKLDQNPGWK